MSELASSILRGTDNDLVLEGKDGFLFLSGGRHSPLRFAQASAAVKPESLRHFWANIQRRQAQLTRRGIRYAHLIAPDKHSVCQEVFPVEVQAYLGDEYLQAAPVEALRSWVVYPRQLLADNYRQNCYRVDTHYRPSGTLLMTRELLVTTFGEEGINLTPNADHLQFKYQSNWSGDLGSKLSPARYEDCERIVLPRSISCYSNRLAGGNNGIIDLYINRNFITADAKPAGLGRVLVSGDSFGRDIARTLSLISQEVLFVRTPFLHVELVDAMKPDVVFTQNAERYLSGVSSDEARPVFFLYPFLKQNEYVVDSETAYALSAILSYGRPPYEAFLEEIRSKPLSC
ncbi:hypothetical protein [Synechococcus sp. CBW1006]|uniref:alginate O-acetyltransferase AlgX-related protein n=1 Tax=Synechococcus sp. CBW1006 TaxID=1353138 RepID=UPI0018CE4324|nr:hypothetical protein [Synechococcus sp. CBW1006]QPN65833.1 hypothetical protein H8F26_13145 [Synechococcus sp. CBW1006]